MSVEKLLTNIAGHIPHHVRFIAEKRSALSRVNRVFRHPRLPPPSFTATLVYRRAEGDGWAATPLGNAVPIAVPAEPAPSAWR
jgi:hypothetical protein